MTGKVITLNLASHVMLGHGLGLRGDIVVGSSSGVGANLLANALDATGALS